MLHRVQCSFSRTLRRLTLFRPTVSILCLAEEKIDAYSRVAQSLQIQGVWGDTKQVRYWGSANIRHHCEKFSRHDDLARDLCTPGLKADWFWFMRCLPKRIIFVTRQTRKLMSARITQPLMKQFQHKRNGRYPLCTWWTGKGLAYCMRCACTERFCKHVTNF